MAINVCRFQPNLFLPVVDRVKRRCPLVTNTLNTDTLMKSLEVTQRLPTVVYDKAAFDAARQNNGI